MRTQLTRSRTVTVDGMVGSVCCTAVPFWDMIALVGSGSSMIACRIAKQKAPFQVRHRIVHLASLFTWMAVMEKCQFLSRLPSGMALLCVVQHRLSCARGKEHTRKTYTKKASCPLTKYSDWLVDHAAEFHSDKDSQAYCMCIGHF